MAEPILELVLKGNDPAKVFAFACGTCRRVAHNKAHAKTCCDPRCEDCGNPTERSWIRCEPCRQKRSAAQEQARFDGATKVSLADYDFEHVCLLNGDYRSVEEVLDHNCDVHEDDHIAYAYACVPQNWAQPDASQVIESLCEDMYEDAHEDLDADSLQTVLEEWLATQPPATAWIVDYSRIVVFDDAVADETKTTS